MHAALPANSKQHAFVHFSGDILCLPRSGNVKGNPKSNWLSLKQIRSKALDVKLFRLCDLLARRFSIHIDSSEILAVEWFLEFHHEPWGYKKNIYYSFSPLDLLLLKNSHAFCDIQGSLLCLRQWKL